MNNGNIYRFDDYIKKYINSYNEKNTDNTISDYQSISVCTTETTYSILQIQPKADLIVDAREGLFATDEKYHKKIQHFINLSYKNNYDLVLTPEYSVPLPIAKNVIKNSDKIESGVLYCLCCNGVKFTDFKKFLDEISGEIEVCNELWNCFKNKKDLVCCLLYITKVKFVLSGGGYVDKVFAIPQFKTTPMKDVLMEFEKSSMSFGSKIIIFGKELETKFFGIICADAFNFELLDELKKIIKNDKLLLFHPQLNAKPQNDYFRFMRNMFINYGDPKSVRIIALNWAKESNFLIQGKKESPINNSWSAIYDVFNDEGEKEYSEILRVNASKGLNIAHDHHVLMCYFSSEELVIDMNLANLNEGIAPKDVSRTLLVCVRECFRYNYDSEKFETYNGICDEMVDHFLSCTNEFSELIDCEKCRKNNLCECTIWEMNRFLASVYNRPILKEFEIINDGKISSITSKHYRSEYSKEKIYICKRIYSLMKNREVTEKFKMLMPNFKYKINIDNSYVYNVVYDTGEEFGERLCRIYYLKYVSKENVQKFYDELCSENSKFAENIMIYYEDEFGTKIYPEKINTNIANYRVLDADISIVGGENI